MVWWVWALIYVGIIAFAFVILGAIGLGAFNHYKSLMRNVKEFTAALPKVQAPRH